jgi:hypothetical protein
MNRVFTVAFDFDGKTHLALATVQAEAYQPVSFQVSLLNSNLHRIVPDGKFSFNCREQASADLGHHPRAEALASCLNSAIRDHLHACNLHR